ncbi:MAG: lytic transglycosylase domain-containing protein [Cyanobium sp.]
MARLSLLLAVSCLGSGLALVGGRALLARLPPLTPDTPTSALERQRRWSPDPWRRREASLILERQAEAAADPNLQLRLLAGQGWGPDPLAAVVLKHQAQAAEALQQPARARRLWQQLLRRFPGDPASADALYALGRRNPRLRQQLRQRFPAHPAALAAALEAGPAPDAARIGALHLARWGARWPGAQDKLQNSCTPGPRGATAAERRQLAAALAELGDPQAALSCLGKDTGLSASGQLALAGAWLQGDAADRDRALRSLVALVRQAPASPEAEEAVRLLSQQQGPASDAALGQLPDRWRASAAVAAHQALAAAGGSEAKAAGATGAALQVLRQWPDDPASWDLQWDLSRRELLSGQWSAALTLLQAIPAERLPPPLAARQRFWRGYAQRQSGLESAAQATWQELLRRNPGGYYGWRAALHLGKGDLLRDAAAAQPGLRAGDRWQPLASGDAGLDRLWRLDQRTEAWETWRQRRANVPPQRSQELLLEGRLRQGVGDDWTGLAQLDRALLRLKPDQCRLLPQLERSLHPPRFEALFGAASRQHNVPMVLLQGVSKQESRFTPAVHSAVGAVGLMQLMPETASELAGQQLSAAALENPQRNVELGSRYLRGLLRQWRDEPILAVASYNAGPGAVRGWRADQLQRAPELWVEAIPYPETRLYVKKVLGNAWSYQELARGVEPRC